MYSTEESDDILNKIPAVINLPHDEISFRRCSLICLLSDYVAPSRLGKHLDVLGPLQNTAMVAYVSLSPHSNTPRILVITKDNVEWDISTTEDNITATDTEHSSIYDIEWLSGLIPSNFVVQYLTTIYPMICSDMELLHELHRYRDDDVVRYTLGSKSDYPKYADLRWDLPPELTDNNSKQYEYCELFAVLIPEYQKAGIEVKPLRIYTTSPIAEVASDNIDHMQRIVHTGETVSLTSLNPYHARVRLL